MCNQYLPVVCSDLLITIIYHAHRNDMINGKPFEDIPHSPDAVYISQYMADFLTAQARKNFHKFPVPEEEKAKLIYNYRTSRTDPLFVETYFFANDFDLLK